MFELKNVGGVVLVIGNCVDSLVVGEGAGDVNDSSCLKGGRRPRSVLEVGIDDGGNRDFGSHRKEGMGACRRSVAGDERR